MKNSFLRQILFILFSIVFIAFIVYNWTSNTSGTSYEETYKSQINFLTTIAAENEILEEENEYTKTPSEYLIDPFLIDSTFYFTKRTAYGLEFNAIDWKKIKTHLNYREKKTPRTIKFYHGYNGNSAADVTETTKVIDNIIMDVDKSFHFSKKGNLLLYLSFDSIANFYDEHNRIRKSISFKRYSSEDRLNQHKNYEYDTHGNLVTYCEFHQNEDGKKYLFSYSTFEYAPSNTGLDIKKTIFRKEYNKDAYDKEIIYYTFNTEKKLTQRKRIFSISSFGVRGRNLTQIFSYIYDKKGQLTSLVQQEGSNSRNKTTYTWSRDDENRLVLHEEKYNIGRSLYNNKDSIVYHTPYERTAYFIKKTTPKQETADRRDGIHRLNFYKEDKYGNLIFNKIFNERNPKDKSGWMHLDYKLKYLPNKTWYIQKQIQSYPHPSKELLQDMEENGFPEDEYSVIYREFNKKSTISDANHIYVPDAAAERMKQIFRERHLH